MDRRAGALCSDLFDVQLHVLQERPARAVTVAREWDSPARHRGPAIASGQVATSPPCGDGLRRTWKPWEAGVCVACCTGLRYQPTPQRLVTSCDLV